MDGEIPSEMLYEGDRCVVIKDINPQAPTHVLVIPRKNIPRLVEAVADDESLLGHLLLVAGKMASKLRVDDAFRLVINNGADAGQTVFLCICTFLLTNRFQSVAWATSLDSLTAAECPIR